MAMTFTIDPRPTVIGNLLLVTGTFDDGDGDRSGFLDLKEVIGSLIHVDANGFNDATTIGYLPPAGNVGIQINCGANATGIWMALGIRA